MRPEALLSVIGKRLASARQRAGLTLSETASRAGLSRRYVSMAENGEANLSILKLAALSSTLRIPLRELCDLDLGAAPALRVALLGLRGARQERRGPCARPAPRGALLRARPASSRTAPA
jgi:transcriptional regulator with XRE-family HTH domain